jgi:S1-C subfamily serine protease
MTRDGKMYPITEILAADKSADLAIVRINASDLTPAPLSEGDPLGSPVTVISHPGGNYFSLTLGHISRYWTTTAQGRSGLRMTITADFADGSSGGPIFNANGSVTGVVCATRPLGEQMVCRFGVPVESIRKLIQTAEPHAK